MPGLDTFIQVAPNSTGEKVRNYENTIGGHDVNQQVVTLAGPNGDVIAVVNAAPAAGDFGLAVRPIVTDGYDPAQGATTDTDTALTVIGRLKKLVTLLPAALVGGRLDVNIGSPTTLPVSVTPTNLGDIGAQADVEASGNGSLIAVTKRLRTLLSGGLPAALVGGRLDVNVGNTPAVTATDLDIRNLLPAQDEVGARLRGQRDDTAPATAAEDAYADARITQNRALHANLRNDAGTEIGTAAAPVRTDPTGTTAQPVTDNASSLTVDAPVGTPVAARLSDGAAFIDPRDVSDRATREVGRTRLWDGVDEATIIPRGTVPSSTDKGLAVVPLNVQRPGYQAVTTEITSATTTGVKENLTLWHPNTLAKDVYILEIGVNARVVQTAGSFVWELQFISAENATPGGTALTPQQLNRGDAASGLTVRQVVTGAPTVTGQIIQRAAFPLPAAATPWVSWNGFIVFSCKDLEDYSDAITLRSGQSEGLRITQNVIAALTTAPVFTVYVRYIERS